MGPGRIAFAVTAILPRGRRVYQHVVLPLRGARFARQVDVETWDSARPATERCEISQLWSSGSRRLTGE